MKQLLALLFLIVSANCIGQAFTNEIVPSGIDMLNTRASTVIDYNNDNYQDLITYQYTSNGTIFKIWRNNGDGTFTDQSNQLNFPQNVFHYLFNVNNDYWSDLVYFDVSNDSVSFAIFDGTQFNIESYYFGIDVKNITDFGDFNLDGQLDIFAVVIFPDNTRGISVFLNNYQNCTNQFSERVDIITGLSSNVIPHNSNFIDIDGDGDQDLVFTAQTGNQWNLYPTKLYRNDNGIFTDVSSTSGLGNNMGKPICTWDYNKDGLLDLVFGTSDQAGSTNRVYQNNGNMSFTNVSSSVVLQNGSHYISPTVADFDNDFDQDVYHGLTSISNHTAQLFRNDAGTFVSAASTYNLDINVGPNVNGAPPSGAPCWFDVENDGDLDVFVGDGNNTYPDNAHLMINPLDTFTNRFLNIDLIGCQSPRLPFGTTVKIKIGTEFQIQEFDYVPARWRSHQMNSRIHFGLGNNQIVDSVYIYWTSGNITTLANVQSNQFLTIEENPGCYNPIVRQTPAPFDIGPDTLSHCGTSLTLDAGTDPSYISYLWNTSEATQTITVDNSGIYSISITDTNGCVGYDTTLVSIIDPTIAQIDTNICIGDSLVLEVCPTGNGCMELPANLQNGLVAHYPFCGNANDESGNGNDGTVNGATLTTDRFCNENSAYYFDGVDDRIGLDAINLPSFTINAWVKVEQSSIGTNSRTIVGKHYSTSFTNSSYVLYSSYGSGPNSMIYYTNTSNNPYSVNSAPISIDTSWHMLTGVLDLSGLKLYRDGVLMNSGTAGQAKVNSIPTIIGAHYNNSGSALQAFFHGIIDDVSLWNLALTPSEIQQLYTLGQYDLTWSTGDTTSSITVQPTTTTTYSVTVDDGISSCTDDVTITVNDPQVTAGADQTICNGDAITLSGAGASTYTWDNSVTDGVAISPTATADYIVTGTDTLGCVAEDTTTITVNSLPTVDAGIFQQICAGDTVTLSGTGAATYTWDNGQTDGTEFTPTTTTLYTVIGTDANGCIDSDTISIGVWSLPLVDAGADQTICDEDLVTLSGSGASTYSWDNSVVDGVGFSPLATTTYTLTGTDANGCSDLAYVTVTVNPLPAVDAGSAQIVCTGTPVTLSATGAVSYIWNNGVTDGVAFTPTNTLLYEVTGTDANSCEATDTVTVTVVAELTVLAGTDQTVCEGTSVTLSGSGANTYTWTGGVTNAIPFTASSTTIYVVTGSDGNNCADTDSVTVNVNPTPDLSSVTTNVSLGMDGEIDLSVTSGTPPYLYDWDNDGIGDFDDPEDLSTLDAGTYSVIVTDDFGCSDTLMVIITEDLQIFISTVITPNGDGMNDTWGVTGLSTDAKVQVLNRWGQVLYNTTGYATPWDGTNNGETLPASDYYYIIDLGQGDVRTGTITLKY